ncbi:hypothetical protein O181_012160 [Austropuccinia psidii MF-1]|uniref:Integrase catalytic domain-containing protein n=1 Tax=Austropuccinia psidii MF-1 TaxID=1389203 RepID=A0A9Q3BWK0_9BASI|nr:hypothetical protein [Austropuccinia psidii MF-1]
MFWWYLGYTIGLWYFGCHACALALSHRLTPCHNGDKSIFTALLIWNRVISYTGIFTKVISDRDPKFTSALWTNLHQSFGTKLSFSEAYHPQTDELAERMIQTLEDMARILCAYGLESKYCDGTNQNPAILEKGWNPQLLQDYLKKDLVEIHPTASSFKGMLDKARKHAIGFMEDSFAYARDKLDRSHATPDFKLGDLVLVSTTNFNKIKGCKNLKDAFVGPFAIKALHE